MPAKMLKPFTMASIERLPSALPGQRAIYMHPKIPGLVVRVTEKGVKSFCFVGRLKGGDMIRETIGRFPACTVEIAENRAKEIAGKVTGGVDPRAARRKTKDDPKFSELFGTYIEQPGRRKNSTLANYKYLYGKHLVALGKLKATGITRSEIRVLHVQLTRENGLYVANRALALIRAVFNYAIDTERIDGTNPAAGIERNQEETREVRLLPSQLSAFLAAVDGHPNDAVRDFVLLALLTGQRKANILAMRWQDVHLADGIWIVPETKNGKPQNVPLMGGEIAILEHRKTGTISPWVFPSHGVSGHLVEPKSAWRAILNSAGIKHGDLRIHDLRRTLGSLMGDTGASLPTIGKALGHMNQLTTAIYARLCLDPVREAKEKAHAVITSARDGRGERVIEFPARRERAGR